MPTIDIESLLVDISQEWPSGELDLADDAAFLNLQIKIAGTPEREFDGKIIREAKDPNWVEIRDAGLELLGRAHDLRVAMFLTRALLQIDGFNGLASGITLLNGLIERYWESLHPKLDPEDNHDPIQRINILAELSEGDEILGPLKRKNLCASPTLGQYSFRDILIAGGRIEATRNDKNPSPNMVDIEAAFKDTDVKDLLSKKTKIANAFSSLSGLKSGLHSKIDAAYVGNVPDFKELQEVLKEMDAIMEKQLEGREIEQSADAKQLTQTNDAGDAQSVGSGRGVPHKPMDVISGRQDVIRVLDQICRYYDRNEPGSPVPLLLKRARQLVEKNFIEIIKDLAPDSADKIKNMISGEDGSK